MSKREFVFRVRSLMSREPSKSEWEDMWDSHCRNQLISLEEIVSRVEKKLTPDFRRIPKNIDRSAVLPLETIGAFGREMYEKFK
jgi:hypothetical protein